jgi:hypothetical protein
MQHNTLSLASMGGEATASLLAVLDGIAEMVEGPLFDKL